MSCTGPRADSRDVTVRFLNPSLGIADTAALRATDVTRADLHPHHPSILDHERQPFQARNGRIVASLGAHSLWKLEPATSGRLRFEGSHAHSDRTEPGVAQGGRGPGRNGISGALGGFRTARGSREQQRNPREEAPILARIHMGWTLRGAELPDHTLCQ
jgi:hypothetical protein